MADTPVFRRLALVATVLTLCVVVLGAYVRLSDAGLGCPDWPGCYGHLDVPESHSQINAANQAFPHRPVQPAKAWKEMIHRYFAGTLGLLILALAWLAWRNRRDPDQQRVLPWVLVVLVVFQALLGRWTVTLQLKPAIVMSHLLGGLTTLALLWWVTLRQGRYWQRPLTAPELRLRSWALLGLVILVVQVALGGWTSANYAALACGADFPTCQTQWWPHMNFHAGFTLWHHQDIDYQYGVLNNPARVAIQMVHRLGALVVLLYIGTLSWQVVRRATHVTLRVVGGVLALLLVVQIGLGISNVVYSLPLPVAVAHNGVAALLLLSMVTLNHVLRPRESG